MVPEIVQFDDPLNPRGWVMEPVRRRVELTFPDVAWTVRAVGMVESWETYDGAEIEGGRAGMAAACARMSERYGMPIDEYLWFDDPPTSSVPACRAIAAAGLQRGDHADGVDGAEATRRLLRACREATFARRRSISDEAQLHEVIASVPGVDEGAVVAAVEDGRAEEAFEAARAEAASLDAPGVGRFGDRCELPTLVVCADGEERGVSGIADFSAYCEAITGVTGLAPVESAPGVADVLERYSPEGWVARVELSRLTDRPEASVTERARELVEAGDVAEETFAAEPFFRLAEFAPEDAEAIDDP